MPRVTLPLYSAFPTPKARPMESCRRYLGDRWLWSELEQKEKRKKGRGTVDLWVVDFTGETFRLIVYGRLRTEKSEMTSNGFTWVNSWMVESLLA